MAYLRNGKRVFTAKDRSIQTSRRHNDHDPVERIYRDTDKRYALTKENLDREIKWLLVDSNFGRPYRANIRAMIDNDQRAIIQRRFEMFATMQWQHTKVWTEGVSASGYYEDRRAWLYYHQQSLKFYTRIAELLSIDIA